MTDYTAPRYFATSAATRKRRPLTSGMDSVNQAREQAKFLADTYGGIGIVTSVGGDQVCLIAKYSTKRGWH